MRVGTKMVAELYREKLPTEHPSLVPFPLGPLATVWCLSSLGQRLPTFQTSGSPVGDLRLAITALGDSRVGTTRLLSALRLSFHTCFFFHTPYFILEKALGGSHSWRTVGRDGLGNSVRMC